jgi:hypothetical protein
MSCQNLLPKPRAIPVTRAAKYALRGKNSYSRKVWQAEALPELDAARRPAHFLKRHATHSEFSRNGAEYRLAQLVAHKAEFDVGFLNSWYERLDMFFPARRQAFCTLQRCLWYFLRILAARH